MGKKNDLMVGVDLGGTSMTAVALDGPGPSSCLQETFHLSQPGSRWSHPESRRNGP